MKALYRKYRPVGLDEVVGQEQVTVPLKKSLAAGKINHAYLFIGPRGCGKTSVARILAHEINGFKYEIEDSYVDIIEIDGASNRGIDNIRELREKVAITPTQGKYKVYIIDEVHMLTKEAFNALLKTLEEPPSHAVFIMATTDAYKVPVTITSRAQTFTFKLADKDTIFKHLQKICENEKIKIDNDALRIVVKRGGGSFRDSLSLLDQISTLSDSQITKDMVISAMGLPEDEKIRELLDCYKSGDIKKIAGSLRDIASAGIKSETLAEELIVNILDGPEPALLPLLSKLPDVRGNYAEAKLLVALTSNIVVPNITAAVRSMPSAPMAPNAPTSPAPEPKSTAFNWDSYSSKVQSTSDAVYSQLIKCKYDFDGATLHIYPMKKIIKSILSRDNNKQILLSSAGPNVKITIHEADETPGTGKNDEMLGKLSAIMGGEVQNDAGGNPF